MNNDSGLPPRPIPNTDPYPKKFTTPQVSDNVNADGSSKTVPDYKFLNDSYFQGSGADDSQPPTVQFSRFPQLPLELRFRIWEHCLPCQRLLRIGITQKHQKHRMMASHPSKPVPERDIYQRRNGLGNIVSGAGYVLHMRSTRAGSRSPLLLVNREANSFVRKHYRIRIPVIGREEDRGDGAQATCLWLRPETDTVWIDVENDGKTVHFADVVHDVLAYDHQGIGILHMAIGHGAHPSTIRLPLQPSIVHSRARAALSHTLGRLQSISLIHRVHTSGRLMLSNQLPAEDEPQFNRAFPIWSRAASFTVLPQDPRPIVPYLEKLRVGSDPHALIRAWQMLEAAYEPLPPATTTPPTRRIRVLLTAIGLWHLSSFSDVFGLVDREDVCWFRHSEENTWERCWRAGGYHEKLWPGTPNPDDEDPEGSLEFAKTKTAVGFWSVPLEAFGEVPQIPYDRGHWSRELELDLTKFKTRIECGLFEI